MTEGFHPYPRAVRRYATERYPLKGKAYAASIFIAFIGAYSSWVNVEQGNRLPALVVLWLTATLSIGGIGVGRMNRKPRSKFRYINAIVMTRAEKPPLDSWVYLAQMRRLPVPILISAGLFVVAMLVVGVYGVLQLIGVFPPLNPDASFMNRLGATVIALALMGAGGWLLWLNLAVAWRNGRVAAAPSGIALGVNGVALHMPSRDAEVRWEHIRSVGSTTSSGKRPLLILVIQTAPEAGLPGNVLMIGADKFVVPMDALHSALQWYFAHPHLRWELDSTVGRDRLDGWRKDAIELQATEKTSIVRRALQ
ncbi:hypothetical protein [Microbacterium sp. YY-01]|uniref:hypothetical protein n=1 Tax=Microbacterium sp. YY-01 TaxID=3421634 RepID=UPI003D184AA8